MLSNLLKLLRITRCQTQNISKSVRIVSQTTHNSIQSPVENKSYCNFTHKFWIKHSRIHLRQYSNPLPPSNNLDEALVDANTYEIVCNETLEALSDYFDEIVESNPALKDADIIYGVSFLFLSFKF